MKKIFVLTGEDSGDALASSAISKLKNNRKDIEYLCVGGEKLKALGIKSIYDLKEITYIGFTDVFLNIFKINKTINRTVAAILKFQPDILFSVDSPDFTLRVADKVKRKNPNIKVVHLVAPQVWVWREKRANKIGKIVDRLLLLFKFEEKYFSKYKVNYNFVGHPLLDNTAEEKISMTSVLGKNQALISIFPGSRQTELKFLLPVLIDFIKRMNERYSDFKFVFHATSNTRTQIVDKIKSVNDLKNCEVISDPKIKKYILKKSIFAINKSGTVSLEIAKEKIPSVVIYKMGLLNYFIVKLLVKVKYANIINIAAEDEIIPELIQSNCNSQKIFEVVSDYLNNPDKIKLQVLKVQDQLKNFTKNNQSSSLNVCEELLKFI